MSRQGWAKIVRSPVYGGWVCGAWTDGRLVPAKFAGPLAPDEWSRLQATLDARETAGRRRPRRAAHPSFPLRRFVRCPGCDRPARGYAAVKRGGRRYGYYDCDRPACRFRVPVAAAHDRFLAYLRSLAPAPGVLAAFRATAAEVLAERGRDSRAAEAAREQKVAALNAEKASLVALMAKAAGDDSLLASLRAAFTRADRELTVAEAARPDPAVRAGEVEAVLDRCCRLLAHADELWAASQPEAKTRLQRLLFPEGLSYLVLERKRTAKLSAVWRTAAELALPKAVAAPRGIEPRFPG